MELVKYDLHAEIDKIIEVTEKPKVTYIGYSQGSAQGLYALAIEQDYYAERINRLIMIGACMAGFSSQTSE